MEKVELITAKAAREEFIYCCKKQLGRYFQANTALRTSKGIPRVKGFVVYLVDFPWRWMYWYKDLRAARRAYLNFNKSFFK